MPIDVIAAVLLAALVHAGWNAIAKSTGATDPMISTSAIAIGGGIVALPLLLVSGLPATTSYPYVFASGVIHVLYFVLVGLAYRAAEYSAVYPITRGSAPLATSLLAAALLGEAMAPLAWCGVVLLSSGILGLGSDSLLRGALSARAISIAGLNVAVIVGYTLIDGEGARASLNPAGYVIAMMAITGALLLPVVMVWLGPGSARALLARWRIGLVGGAMVSLSYGIALWAMTKAPIGMVAALRETSVLFATIIAACVLREKFGLQRWISTGLILAGLAAIRMG